MANFRGQDGSATFATVGFAELRVWSLDGVALETIDDTVKGDTHRTFKGGIGDGGTITVSGLLDYATAQQDVIDLINAGTGAPIAFEMIITTTGPKKFTGNCVPQSYSLESPDGSANVTITFNAKVSGAVAADWT